MNKLLTDEYPQIILPSLAVRIGINEAIVLQQIHYWVELNKTHNRNYHDGYYWVYNSYSKWKKEFPYWSQKKIQRTLEKLREHHLVITATYNKLSFDKTLWYRINYKAIEALEKQPLSKIDLKMWTECFQDLVNLTSLDSHSDYLDLTDLAMTIPETNQRLTPEITSSSSNEDDEAVKVSIDSKDLKSSSIILSESNSTHDNIPFLFDETAIINRGIEYFKHCYKYVFGIEYSYKDKNPAECIKHVFISVGKNVGKLKAIIASFINDQRVKRHTISTLGRWDLTDYSSSFREFPDLYIDNETELLRFFDDNFGDILYGDDFYEE